MEHPAVAEAGVIGKPDPVAGAAGEGVRRARARLRADRGVAPRAARVRRAAARRGGGARRRSTSAPTCRRRGAARSCAGCCGRASSGSPKATRRRWRADQVSRDTDLALDHDRLPPRRAAGSRHDAGPALRGALRRALQRQQDPRLPAPLHRRGGGGRRRDAAPPARRRGGRDLPRARARTGLRGVRPRSIMAEMFGKVEGCSRGRGGSMHLFDVARPLLRRQRHRRRRAPDRGRAGAGRPACRDRHACDRVLLRRRARSPRASSTSR